MDKKEVTARIYEHMQEIRKIYQEFCPEDKYLALFVGSCDGWIGFYNEYWNLPFEKRIDFCEDFEEDEE